MCVKSSVCFFFSYCFVVFITTHHNHLEFVHGIRNRTTDGLKQSHTFSLRSFLAQPKSIYTHQIRIWEKNFEKKKKYKNRITKIDSNGKKKKIKVVSSFSHIDQTQSFNSREIAKPLLFYWQHPDPNKIEKKRRNKIYTYTTNTHTHTQIYCTWFRT